MSKEEEKKYVPFEVIQKLPKADLHRHLDGSARPETILELAKEQGVDLPTFDIKELSAMLRVGEACTSLVEYLKSFEITLRVMQVEYAITRIMFEVCEDAMLDGLCYLEVRFSPVLHTALGLTFSAVMEAVCAGRVLAEMKYQIKVGIIVCGMRQMSPDITEALAEVAWRYREKGVVGFDLAGPEDGFPAKVHKSAFDVIRINSLNVTLHSGEASSWNSIQHAIRYCGANRIGHGVNLRQNSQLLDYVVDRRIPLEICVTSNIQTKAVEQLSEHPVRLFHEKGVLIVICTDNTTVSNVTVSAEFDLLQREFGFTPVDFVSFIDSSLRAAFIPLHVSIRLRAHAVRESVKLLREAGFPLKELNVMKYQEAGKFFLDDTVAPQIWGEKIYTMPSPVTYNVFSQIPLCDLHCRLVGSVSLEGIWKQLRKMFKHGPVELPTERGMETFANIDSLRSVMQPPGGHTSSTTKRAESIMNAVLMTNEQIEDGLQDIIFIAQSEGVVYMELVVFPTKHTSNKMNAENVTDLVLKKIEELGKEYPSIRVNVILSVQPDVDDPIVFNDIARLAVKNRANGVVAFGIFGDDIPPEHYNFYYTTLDYLKANNFNVVMAAGKSDASSITSALQSGAVRLSGAFQVHKEPRIMNFLALHHIPVEINLTDKMRRNMTEVESFADSPIRLFLDHDLLITICSFAKTLYPYSRLQQMQNIVEECGFSISDTLRLVGNSYNSMLLPLAERRRYMDAFWGLAKERLQKMGYGPLRGSLYFPELDGARRKNVLE